MAMSTSTHILVLAHVFPRSLDDTMGAFLLHLADALSACGVSTTIVAPHAPQLADEQALGDTHVRRFRYAPARWERLAYTGTMHELVGRGIANKLLFVLFNLAFLFKTVGAIRATKPAVLHAHWWLPDGLVGALAALVTRVPLVITTHGTDVEMLRRKRFAKPIARFVFSRARAITCGSTYLRDQLLALGVAKADKVAVIPMPVNPIFQIAEFKSQIGTSAETRRANPYILTIARLTKQKSIETLIDALATLRDRGNTCRLVIIGDGPEREALQEQVNRLGLQDGVEFLGEQPQSALPRFYANCRVFVLPSVREGMGLVLAEALLCGAPVISTRSGGVTDIVRDGETGLLVPEREPAVLADGINELLSNRELAARLAENGRVWVMARYTPASIATRFAALYHGACSSGRNMSDLIPPEPSEGLDNKSPISKLHLRRIAGIVLAFAVLVFLGRLLWQTWGDLTATEFRFEFDLPRLALSLGLLVVARAFAVEAWRRVLISLGESFGFAFGARVWFLSNLTRYIPGNIWQVATMMTMVEQRGVSKTNALLSQVIYTALALSIAGLLGTGFFLVRPEALQGFVPPELATYAPLLMAAGFVALVILYASPPVNHVLVKWTVRLTHRSITAPTPTFTRGLVPPFFSLAMWLTNGIAFYLFVSSLADVSLEQLPAFIAMHTGAYVIGYLSFITPSGLGFREGALAWMLGSMFPTPVAIALSLAARLWSTAGELLGVVLVWAVPDRKPAAEGPQTP